MDIKADDGYFFGLGFFETIAVEQGVPLFLDWHLERLADALSFLGISFPYGKKDVENILKDRECPPRGVLKIVVSGENTLFLTRENHYGPKDYREGFCLSYSQIRRNETSPLTYRKSLNYGDCILEKRAVKGSGVQEPVFLNTRGELTEGATTNLFFVKNKKLYTPKTDCGLLPGIVRRWVLEEGERLKMPVEQARILLGEVEEFEECFVTNSLLGIMPVNCLGKKRFTRRETVNAWMERYGKAVKSQMAGA